ncbi:TRAP transporter substrate-binding protein [Frigidibacter sp. MR17.24]|uniref:TRAP transporter substrate-binding protein n=1 Tax=Frigidibacter sp. MR17.24 TaxID=3127345 RepID=UPI003012BA45
MTNFTISRRGLLQSAGIATLAGSFGLGPHVARAAGVKLKLGHQLGSTHPTFQAVEQMAKAIAERTGGEVEIAIFPNAALGSPPDMVKQAQMGALDLVMFNPPNIEAQDRTASVIQIPYQFDSYDHVHRVLGGTAKPWLMEFFDRNKLQWIANFEYGFRALSNSRRPIETPEDVAGLKLRVPPELSIKATFDALGANTQTIPFDELYLALSSGVVDGQDNPVSVDYANKFFEVQKHIATTRHIYTSFMLVGSPRVWKGLSPDVQAVISEEAAKAGAWAQQAVRDGEEEMLSKMADAGVQITRPDPQPFRDRMEPAWAQMRERIGEDTWTTWMGFVDSARSA